VTPKIISNLNETIEELSGDKKDPEAIDGFEDLSPENQERVVRALEQGHVDDDEWKGVSSTCSFTRLSFLSIVCG
jgi:ubiquitin-conjugating enzyme E2 O